MKKLLALFLLLVASNCFSQSIKANYYTTNGSPAISPLGMMNARFTNTTRSFEIWGFYPHAMVSFPHNEDAVHFGSPIDAPAVAGDGSALTGLTADQLTSGTIPSGRFPATYPAGSGVNLTALNASNLGSGTVPDARFPAVLPVLSGANLTALAAANLTGSLPAISGASLTSLNASQLTSGTVPDARFPATLPAASGVNLTALNAANLGSGTVPTARLGSGSASITTVLYGNSTWGALPASGLPTSQGNGTNETLYFGIPSGKVVYNGTGNFWVGAIDGLISLDTSARMLFSTNGLPVIDYSVSTNGAINLKTNLAVTGWQNVTGAETNGGAFELTNSAAANGYVVYWNPANGTWIFTNPAAIGNVIVVNLAGGYVAVTNNGVGSELRSNMVNSTAFNTSGGTAIGSSIVMQPGAIISVSGRSRLTTDGDGTWRMGDSSGNIFTGLTFGPNSNLGIRLANTVNGGEVQTGLGAGSTNWTVRQLIATNGIVLPKGANKLTANTVALVAGVATVNNTAITANTLIMPWVVTQGGTLAAGNLIVTRSAGVSFTITSTALAGGTTITDTSTIGYLLIENP